MMTYATETEREFYTLRNARIWQMRQNGATLRAIGKAFGLSTGMVHVVLILHKRRLERARSIEFIKIN